VRAERCLRVGRDQAALWGVLGVHVVDFTWFSPNRETSAAGARVDTPDREGGAHVMGIAYRESGAREARGIGEAAASAHARGWKCFVACLALRRVPCSRGLSLTRACVFSVRRPATARASDERLREPGQRPGATRGPPCCEEDEASSCSPQSVPCGQAWRLLRSPCRRRPAPS
jgi:hypothetical protein